MGCASSRGVVVELPRDSQDKTRRSSTGGGVTATKENNTGFFSRPGSGPVALNGDVVPRKKNQISVEPQIPKPRSTLVQFTQGSDSEHSSFNFNGRENSHNESESALNLGSDTLRKGSAQSKTSNDSGISVEQQKLLSKPLLVNVSGVPSPVVGLKLDEETLSKPVSRLGSKEILSQLNDIGIVPLRTNRCGSSLAFNIDISSSNDVIVAAAGDHSSLPSAQKVEHEQQSGSSDVISSHRPSMPPPNRLARLKTLPPIKKISKEEIEAKQLRAEERRKKREEKIKIKSEQLRQRKVSEAEMSEREDDIKEKISQDLHQKLIQTELNKQRLREIQMEKQRKHEERLQRVKINREKMQLNNVGGYGDQMDSQEGDIESSELEKSVENTEFAQENSNEERTNHMEESTAARENNDATNPNEEQPLGTSQGAF